MVGCLFSDAARGTCDALGHSIGHKRWVCWSDGGAEERKKISKKFIVNLEKGCFWKSLKEGLPKVLGKFLEPFWKKFFRIFFTYLKKFFNSLEKVFP